MVKKWSDSKFFRMASGNYDENQNKIIDILNEKKNAVILDIGCNNGNLTVKAAKKINTTNIFGIEIDTKAAKKAKNKGIDVKICDINKKFPFKDNFFDVIISNQVIEHVENTDHFFSEIHRVLKPNGCAIISTQNLASLHNLFLLFLGMQPISLHISKIQVGNFLYGTQTSGHIKCFTIPALNDLAKYHGFETEKSFGIGMYPFPYFLSRILTKIFKRYSVFIGVKIRKIK